MNVECKLCYSEALGFALLLHKNQYAPKLPVYTEKDQITEVSRESVADLSDYMDRMRYPGRFRNSRNLPVEIEAGRKLFQEGGITHRPAPRGGLSVTVDRGISIIHGFGYNFNGKSSCTCRDDYCRHKFADYYYLLFQIKKLKLAFISSKNVTDKSFFVDDDIEKLLYKEWDPANLTPGVIEELYQLTDLILKPDSVSYVGGVLDFLFRQEPEYWGYDPAFLADKQPVIGAFCVDPRLSQFVTSEETEKFLTTGQTRQYRGNRAYMNRFFKLFKNAKKNIEKGKLEESWAEEFLLKYTKQYDLLLKYLAGCKAVLSAGDLLYLQQLPEEMFQSLSPEEEEKLLAKVDEAEGKATEPKFPVMNLLLGRMEAQKKISVLSKLQHYHLDPGMYRALPVADQIRLACSMPVEEKTVLFILEKVLPSMTVQEKADYLLYVTQKAPCRASLNCLSVTAVKQLIQEAQQLPHHGLLKPYMEDTLLPVDMRKTGWSIAFDAEDLQLCFRGSYYLQENEYTMKVVYNLHPLHGEGEIVAEFREEEGQLEAGGPLERRFSKESVQALVSFCVGEDQETLRVQKQELSDRIAERKFEKSHMAFMWGYRELCKDLKEEKVLFDTSFKARLQYHFDLNTRQPLLSFKVGNVKSYVVKDGNAFLDAFRKHDTITYGKDLILTHDLENLAPEDRPVIELLSPMHFPNVAGDASMKRYLPVAGPLFSGLMRQLSGRQVFVGDAPCLVRLAPVELKVKVDSSYRLILPVDEKKQKLIVTDDKAFLMTDDGKEAVIDQVSCSPEEARLLSFVQENQGVAIHPILNGFKKDIYARFSGMFDLDERVKPGFKLSVIRISAYFDYQDKKIQVRCEYARDDAPLRREQIVEPMDIAKIGAFETALTSLGFENGVLSDEGHILSFMKMDFSGLKRLANIYLSESLNNKKLLSVSRQTIKISCGKSGIIEAVLEKSEFSEAELEEILTGLKKKKKFILLSGDRIIDLSSEEAAEFGETVRDLGLKPGQLMKKKRIEMVGALKAFAHENNCSIDRQLRNIIEEVRNFKDYETKLPVLSAQLRPYQEEGYRWLSVLSKNNLGGILADDMGLGKTLQMIALIKSDKTKKPSLIVCPKSLVFNWISEFRRFDGETEVVGVYGLSSRREEIIRNIDYGKKAVYVTSYDSLRNDITLYEGTFQYAVLDEAQFIKNVAAQKSKSVKEIQAVHRFALTGTPIENNIIDLWSIFEFIMPGYFEELSEFRSQAGQEGFHETLAKRIGPFVLRRVKENVLSDLPQKYERILSCEMTPEQKKLYEALKQKARKAMESGGKAFDMLPQLMQMRQVCVDPAMFTENYRGESGKLLLLEEMIPRYIAEGHRILIFSQFVKGLERVEKLLEKHQIPYYLLTGQTSAQERARMIDEFNSTTGTDVFLISLKAGGTGLNLTGADTVIHLDPWWNAAAENQATDRAHRIGQTRNVEVIKLISEDSIEQRVIELQDMKKDLFDKVIAKDESSVTGASLEDIAFILQ